MKKIYGIKYIKDAYYDGENYYEDCAIERSAFTSYHAASYFLLNVGFSPIPVDSFTDNFDKTFDLFWSSKQSTDDAEIVELLLIE